MDNQNVVSPRADVSRVPPSRPPDRQVPYKKIAQPAGVGGELQLHVYLPPNWQASDRRPAIVLFFGGGWRIGQEEQFFSKAEYLAARGLVAFCADYRVQSRHQTTLNYAVEDARSAMRFVRAQADRWGVDAKKIIAAGGSSGAHMAAACALFDGPDDPADDRNVSCRPQALVLFNPPLNLASLSDLGEHFLEIARSVAPGNTEAAKKAALKKLSPMEYVSKGAPPAIMFFGSNDAFLPDARAFAASSRSLGNRVEMWVAPNIGHGFFNATPWHQATLIKLDEFLASLGFLSGPPAIPSADPSAVLASFGENVK